jgi:hypothetical protein
MLIILDGNSSYFNLDMLHNNPQLFTQLEQEYYVNKTGLSFLTVQKRYLTFQVRGLRVLSTLLPSYLFRRSH